MTAIRVPTVVPRALWNRMADRAAAIVAGVRARLAAALARARRPVSLLLELAGAAAGVKAAFVLAPFFGWAVIGAVLLICGWLLETAPAITPEVEA